MTVRYYVRGSTSHQRETPEIQREHIFAYCARNNLGEPLAYQDLATSGGKPIREREAGGCLMADIQPGDHLVVAKLDRMFRNLRDCVTTLDEFRQRKIHLHVCNFGGAPVDLTTSVGRLLVHMIALVAEFERELISERTTDAIRSLKRRGHAVGRPHYGYRHEWRRVDGRKVRMEEPCPAERQQMAELAEMKRKRFSVQQIFEEVTYRRRWVRPCGRPWTRSAIRDAIKAELLLQLSELKRNDAESR